MAASVIFFAFSIPCIFSSPLGRWLIAYKYIASVLLSEFEQYAQAYRVNLSAAGL